MLHGRTRTSNVRQTWPKSKSLACSLIDYQAAFVGRPSREAHAARSFVFIVGGPAMTTITIGSRNTTADEGVLVGATLIVGNGDNNITLAAGSTNDAIFRWRYDQPCMGPLGKLVENALAR